MPKKRAIERAQEDKRAGKAASTQAGEFVREEVRAYKEGRGHAKSQKQAVAIGLSEARRSGVDLPPPKQGQAGKEVRAKARRDLEKGRRKGSV